MFHDEFYANRIATIEAEIKRKQVIASLIFSDSKLCQKRAEAAIRRIAKLREQILTLEHAAAVEAELAA